VKRIISKINYFTKIKNPNDDKEMNECLERKQEEVEERKQEGLQQQHSAEEEEETHKKGSFSLCDISMHVDGDIWRHNKLKGRECALCCEL